MLVCVRVYVCVCVCICVYVCVMYVCVCMCMCVCVCVVLQCDENSVPHQGNMVDHLGIKSTHVLEVVPSNYEFIKVDSSPGHT